MINLQRIAKEIIDTVKNSSGYYESALQETVVEILGKIKSPVETATERARRYNHEINLDSYYNKSAVSVSPTEPTCENTILLPKPEYTPWEHIESDLSDVIGMLHGEVTKELQSNIDDGQFVFDLADELGSKTTLSIDYSPKVCSLLGLLSDAQALSSRIEDVLDNS